MSHLAQRKDKNCLNCGATVIGKYCHVCGQENVEPEESFWHLVSHFFNDLTHFDGQFISSLKDLLFKPGFLSKEYMNGRRASYLNPIRMYLFTSFIFFLIFFSTIHLSDKQFSSKISFNGKTIEQIDKMSPEDFEAFTELLNDGKPMTREAFHNYFDSIHKVGGIRFNSRIYKSKEEYDSLTAKDSIKPSWLQRQFNYRLIEITKKYGNEQAPVITAIVGGVIHHFPQMLFISLPFVALFLKLLYFRRKKFYYVSHVIFTIHFYVFVFIAMLVELIFSEIKIF
ncbi:MAG: DUF3667 domain-containing protein, partial [Ginsengibacter sp.]